MTRTGSRPESSGEHVQRKTQERRNRIQNRNRECRAGGPASSSHEALLHLWIPISLPSLGIRQGHFLPTRCISVGCSLTAAPLACAFPPSIPDKRGRSSCHGLGPELAALRWGLLESPLLGPLFAQPKGKLTLSRRPNQAG